MRSLSPCGASASAASAACRFERWPLPEEIRRFSLAEYGPRLSQSKSWLASSTAASAPRIRCRTSGPALPRWVAIATSRSPSEMRSPQVEESCGTSKKAAVSPPTSKVSPASNIVAPRDSPTPGAAKTATPHSRTRDRTPEVWSACPWVRSTAPTPSRLRSMRARRPSMRRHESPASTSKPPLLDSMYVALPELPLESTLSRKPFLQPSGWDRQWSLSEILARPELPAGGGGCDPARPRSRRISSPIVADRGRQYLLLADEDLISLVEANDDPVAFAALYDRHSRTAYSLPYWMMGEPQSAEDPAQEVFL